MGMQVSWNSIGALGVASFAHLFQNGSCCQLTTLDLSYNGIGHEGKIHSLLIARRIIYLKTLHRLFVPGVKTLVRVWQTVSLPPDLQVHIMGNGVTNCNFNNIPARSLSQVLLTSRPCLTLAIPPMPATAITMANTSETI